MRKLLITCIIIFFNNIVNSQNADSVFCIALYAFAHNDTLLAQKEIQRAILFDTSTTNPQKYIAAATIYAASGNISKAEFFLNQTYQKVNNKLHHSEILLTKSDIYISATKYFNAIATLLQIDTEENKGLDTAVNIRLGICYFNLQRYNESQECFLKAVTESQKPEIEKIIRKAKKQRHPSPLICGISSALIPGTGQYMSLRVVDGLSSEVILGSLALLGVYLAEHYGNWTAILCVLPWVQRYYLGGIKNAVQCARSRKVNKNRHYICLINNMLNIENNYLK